MKPSALALLSGGLDSLVATALALRERPVALALTFDYGQRAARREIDAAAGFSASRGIPHEVIALPWLESATATALVDRGTPLPACAPAELARDGTARARAVWVPNRNGLFVAIAAAIAEARGIGTIVAGFNAEEAATFPDNSIAFVECANAALAHSTRSGVALVSPTIAMTKEEIARSFVELGLDAVHLWSCYDGGQRHCGSCESCARAERAFRKADAWNLVQERFA